MGNRVIGAASMMLYLKWLSEAIERLNRCPNAHVAASDEWFALLSLNALQKNLLADCVTAVELAPAEATAEVSP